MTFKNIGHKYESKYLKCSVEIASLISQIVAVGHKKHWLKVLLLEQVGL